MNALRRFSTFDIPREIREQEKEIELIFQNLDRFDKNTGRCRAQERASAKKQTDVVAWILIAVFGCLIFTSIHLLLAKASGN
jgi:hypothetical protein